MQGLGRATDGAPPITAADLEKLIQLCDVYYWKQCAIKQTGGESMVKRRKADDDVEEIREGVKVWVLTTVTRVEHDEKSKLARVTVMLSNGHKETVAYDPEEVAPA